MIELVGHTYVVLRLCSGWLDEQRRNGNSSLFDKAREQLGKFLIQDLTFLREQLFINLFSTNESNGTAAKRTFSG